MRKTVVLHSPGQIGYQSLSVDFAVYNTQAGRKRGSFGSSYPREITMERVTLRIPKQQIEEVEQMVETGEYPNRSEAIRSAVREMLSEQESSERSSESKKRTWARV